MSRRGKGQRCCYCNRTLEATSSPSRVAATKDHVVPKSEGGVETVWACWQCNHIKANMPLVEWQRFMAENPGWWSRQSGIRQRRLWVKARAVDANIVG